MVAGLCYDSLTRRGCPLPEGTCQLRHDMVKCSCGLVLDQCNHTSHLGGRRHLQILNGIAPAQSKRARARNDIDVNATSAPNGNATRRLFCQHCRRKYDESEYAAHLEQHTTQESLQAARELARQDKNGISVAGHEGVDFGIVEESAEGAVRVELPIIRTDNQEAPISLKKCIMLSSSRQDHGVKFTAQGSRNKYVRPGRCVTISFQPSYAGRFEDTLELLFYDHARRETFIIQRTVSATVGDRVDHERLRVKAPYEPRRRRNIALDGPVKRSLRPPDWTPTTWKSKLPGFDIPAGLIRAAFTPEGYLKANALRDVRTLMPSAFTASTYGQYFQTMIYLDEQQMKQDLDAYSMSGAEIKADHPRYNLEVAGLSEGRPSVNVGDFILVRPIDSPGGTWFEGRVHRVAEKHVSLRFSDKFNIYRGTKFDVRFVLNRLSFRRMHNALVNRNDPPRILFPELADLRGASRVTQRMIQDVTPVNRIVGQNREQMETVTAILNQRKGSVPFVVFGPPGTGKTVTLVETINQLLQRDPDVRILACAPSNSAADILTKKLVNLTSLKLIRLNSLTRKYDDLPIDLRHFALFNDNKVFAMPTLANVLTYNVVVSTCISAGALAGLGVKKGHFSYIFVDEAGQGKEPEVILPVKELADKNTNIVLAGDLKQLGPIVHSRLAKDLGLKQSYLERLMNRPCYKLETEEGEPNVAKGVTIMQLVDSFRSHPAILRYPNEMFYGNQLRSRADDLLVRSLETSEALPTKRFPIVFHAVVGKDQRERASPSFFNIDEATIVKKYCAGLLAEDRRKRLVTDHIGVITPYHSQRMKILELLHRDAKLSGITVGSVEEFQGQERRVIIISTVRSNTSFVDTDIRRSLGFVANLQRFNVAVTRAQALLIVVGNPHILALDPLWRGFMNYIYLNGGWKGPRPSWNPDVPLDDPAAGSFTSTAKNEAEEELARLRSLILRAGDGGNLLANYEGEEGDIEGDLGDGLVVEQD